MRKLVLLGALMAIVALLSVSSTMGSGTLPTAGFTWIADQGTVNSVNITGKGIRLKTKGPITVKTTYTKVPSTCSPDPCTSWSNFTSGWHYHNGPVIVSVTMGTLTLFRAGEDRDGDHHDGHDADNTCRRTLVHAGEAYIESPGQVLRGQIQAGEQSTNTTVEFFTTRLYPMGATDPVPVAAPCTIP